MSLSLDLTHCQWMGYNGTESALMALLRDLKEDSGPLTPQRRQDILDEIELRLLIIKIQCNLVSEDELRKVIEGRERERRRRLEEEEELARKRKEEFNAALRELLEEERYDRSRIIKELRESMSDSVEREKRLIHAGLALPSNTYRKVNLRDLCDASKGYLYANDACLICYLDGSIHPSIEELDSYSEAMAKELSAKYRGKVNVPRFRSYLTNEVYLAQLHMENCRKQLDAYRCKLDPEFVSRLRLKEREAVAAPYRPKRAVEVEEEEVEEDQVTKEERMKHLIRELEEATKAHNELLASYNIRAKECAENFREKVREAEGRISPISLSRESSAQSFTKEDVTDGGRYLRRLTDEERKLMYYQDRFLQETDGVGKKILCEPQNNEDAEKRAV